jgi:hypothetical protein
MLILIFKRISGDVRILSPILPVRRGLQPNGGHGSSAPNRQLRMLALRHDFGDLEHRTGSNLPILVWPRPDAWDGRNKLAACASTVHEH